MMDQIPTWNCVCQKISEPNKLAVGPFENHGLFTVVNTMPCPSLLYHNFNDWLACHPGMEDLMDQNPSLSQASSGVMEDIRDAPGLYEILGPNGNPFICKDTDDEGRYLFSFNVDSFNPFRLKQGGQSASVMGLHMVCSNLPLEMQLKPENMFLAGIIPGPHELSKDKINIFLSSLVDNLLESYITGYNIFAHGSTPVRGRQGVHFPDYLQPSSCPSGQGLWQRAKSMHTYWRFWLSLYHS